MSSTSIREISAREILSTGSFPTIEATVTVENGVSASASTPRGSSEGTHEPAFLLDGEPSRYHGKGMLKAVEHVQGTIADALRGRDVREQAEVDDTLRELDGTEKFSRLGVNSVLAVSLACARAASGAEGVPLYDYLCRFFDKESATSLPRPMVVVIEGGMHADNSTDFQEYMVLGLDADRRVAIRNCAEVYQELRRVLKEAGHDVNVGYEGAYAFTKARTNDEPLALIETAIRQANLEIGKGVALALDPAASEFHRDGMYELARENRSLSSGQMVDLYEDLIRRHPAILSVEDGLSEDDWPGWRDLRARVGEHALIVGDDLTVTNTERVLKGVETRAINALLVKPNQAGTLSQTISAIKAARDGGCEIVVSHRGGGETNDTFIVDLAIASDAAYLKCGITRGERVAKFNYLMQIAERFGDPAQPASAPR